MFLPIDEISFIIHLFDSVNAKNIKLENIKDLRKSIAEYSHMCTILLIDLINQ